MRTLRRSALSGTQTKQSSLLSWRWVTPPSPKDQVQLVVGRGKRCSFHSPGCAEFLQGRSNDLICDGLQVSFRLLGSLWKISECGRSCCSWEKPVYHCREMHVRAAASCVRAPLGDLWAALTTQDAINCDTESGGRELVWAGSRGTLEQQPERSMRRHRAERTYIKRRSCIMHKMASRRITALRLGFSSLLLISNAFMESLTDGPAPRPCAANASF